MATSGSTSGSPSASSLTSGGPQLTFSGVTVGSSSTQSLALKNSGGAAITISGISINGAGFSASGVPSGMTLQVGQGVTLSVTYTPSSTAPVSGSLTVSSSAPNPILVVSLSGSGVQAAATPPPSVTLNWVASVSPVAGYTVFRSLVSGTTYAQVNPAAVTGTQYTDNSVQSGQTYFYVVAAVSPSGLESSYSNQAAVTVP